jgi:hypothetical protein
MTKGQEKDPFDDETAAEDEAQRSGAGREEFEDETTEKEIVVPPGEVVAPGEVVKPPAEKIAGADEERFEDEGGGPRG